MQLYKSFLKQLIRNYMIGSIAAVLVVGGVLMVTTLEIPIEEGAPCGHTDHFIHGDDCVRADRLSSAFTTDSRGVS